MKSSLSRRALLRGAGGVVVGLPFLESWPREAKAATPPVRFVVFFTREGTINNRMRAGPGTFSECIPVNDWTPTGSEDAPVYGPILEPLTPHKDKILVLSGIDNEMRYQNESDVVTGAHDPATASALTAATAVPVTPATGDPYLSAEGPSIDQVLAQRLSSGVAVPSVDLKVFGWGGGYGEVSYAAAHQRIAREIDPVAAWQSLFSGFSPDGPSPELLALHARRMSVLDAVKDGFQLTQKRLSGADRKKVEAHFEHIRALEQKLDTLIHAQCEVPSIELPEGIDLVHDAGAPPIVAPLHVEIAVMALACGLTNVATIDIHEFYDFPWLPTPFQDLKGARNHHTLTHDMAELMNPAMGYTAAEVDAWHQEMLGRQLWFTGEFKRLLDRMDAIDEGGSTLLDNSVVLYASEFNNGGRHDSVDMPYLLAGKGGGALRSGRHVRYHSGGLGPPSDYDTYNGDYVSHHTTNDLFAGILNVFGFDDDGFGSGAGVNNGPLPNLT